MTSMPKFALVAATALVGLGIMSVSGGVVVPQQEATLAQPFWQLQGAGPASPRELDAIVAMRNAAREALVPNTIVAAR
jgi:hypothetical protein